MLQYTARITSTDTPRVGGRNLIIKGDKEKSSIGKYVTYYLHTPIDKAEPFTLSFDVLSVDRPPIKGKFHVLFMYRTRFKTSVPIKYEEGRVRYSCIIDTRDREAYDKGFKANAVYIYPNEGHYTPDETPDVGGFTIANVKLERGTVATDWTPAPEDLDDRISTVNTSLTSLASTLLDPEQGEIHKLTSQLESHKKATDKSFDDLATHPLTIDDNGYWQIWSVKDSKYLTTQYQSRGRDGKDGAKGDKGDTPNLSLDEQYRLVADGQLVSQYSLKGADGRNGAKGADGKDGQDGHSPTPEEVLRTNRFKELLGGEVTTQVAPVSKRIDAVKKTADQTSSDLATANTKLTDLDKRSFTTDQKRDLDYLTNSLQVLRSADNNTLEGLALQRIIALSSNNQTISAYLASNAMPAVLKAGITDFGTPQEREQVEITHQGAGHLGNLYFANDTIDFRKDKHTDPYLSIGAEEATFIETFVEQARLDDTPVSVSSVSLTASNAGYQRTVSVDNDGTRLTITLDKINVAVYMPSTLRLTLDGVTIAEWQGKTTFTEVSGTSGDGGGKGFKVETEPYEASNLSYERVVRAGSHIVRLAVVNPTSGETASVTGLRVRRLYDTEAQQSLLTKSGLRLFGSPDRYLDVDYRPTYLANPGFGNLPVPNPYLLRIKGGAKVDKLTADELDVPGVPLCGATFDESGSSINSFGARAKQQGSNSPLAYRAYNADFYRVYHSIGHKNYIPVLQVYGLSNGNYTQSLTTRIDAIEANSFAVRILTTDNVSIKHSFSYVAFKTTE